MKKILFALVLLTPLAAAAESVQTYNNYFGFFLTQPNIQIKTNGEWNETHNFHSVGYGITFGAHVPDTLFRMEIEAGFMGFSLSTGRERDDMDNLAVMVTGLVEKQFFGFISPYAGLGLGLSLWFNDIKYAYVGPSGFTSGNESTVQANISYQVKTGIILNLSERFDLDVSAKYQNLGRPSNKIPVFDISDNVWNLEFRFGGLFRF